jgi:MoxR-like ATPase
VRALLDGRQHVSISDIRSVAVPALRHRIGRSFEAEAEGLDTADLVQRVLGEVPETEGRVQRELGR